jgi:hypothetical protein
MAHIMKDEGLDPDDDGQGQEYPPENNNTAPVDKPLPLGSLPSSQLPPSAPPPATLLNRCPPVGWWAIRMRQTDIDLLGSLFGDQGDEEQRLALLVEYIELKVGDDGCDGGGGPLTGPLTDRMYPPLPNWNFSGKFQGLT